MQREQYLMVAYVVCIFVVSKCFSAYCVLVCEYDVVGCTLCGVCVRCVSCMRRKEVRRKFGEEKGWGEWWVEALEIRMIREEKGRRYKKMRK